MVENAQWANAEKTSVHATIDGQYWNHIRTDEQSELQRQIQDWIDGGNEPAPYVPTNPFETA